MAKRRFVSPSPAGAAKQRLVVLDEFMRRCLAIVVARRLRSDDVHHCLADIMVSYGQPEHIRSDNGPEFIATNVRDARPLAGRA